MSAPRDQVMDTALRIFFGDEYANADQAIRAVAGYEVPRNEDLAFVEFVQWINTRPEFIDKWRSEPERELTPYVRFMNGIQDCHLSRLREIETAVHTILEQDDCSEIFSKGTVATLGSLQCCHFEYQAFIMAYRRALDRLAYGFSTYFKHEQSSFRRFAEHLPTKYHPQPVAHALSAVCEKHVPNFSFVMNKERGKSIRDRLAHKEAVQAGTINVGNFGHRIIGGGEDLCLGNFADAPRLADTLDKHLYNLRLCVSELLGAFRTAVNKFERRPAD